MPVWGRQAYHIFCITVGDHMDAFALASWRCVNCKLCEVCCQVTPEDDNLLQVRAVASTYLPMPGLSVMAPWQCESCDKGYHLSCVSPTLSAVGVGLPIDSSPGQAVTSLPRWHLQAPKDSWYCGSCVQCRMCDRARTPVEWSSHMELCLDCGGHSQEGAEKKLR
jgi:hypothetical protein